MSETKRQAYLPKDLLIESLRFATEDSVGVEDFIGELRELAIADASIDDLISQLSPEQKSSMKREAEELLAMFPPVNLSDISQEERDSFSKLVSSTPEEGPTNKEQVFLPKDLLIKTLESVTGNSVGVEDFIEKLGELARTKTPSPVNS